MIEREGADSFLALVADARRTIRLASQGLDAPEPTQRWYLSRGEKNRPDQLATDIARTLDEDLGISTGQVVTALRNSLLADRNVEAAHGKIPTLRPKEGLTRWLGRLARVIPSSILLHHVSKIKNDLGRRDPSDWPLRDRND
jgi:hypothetical protein